MINEDSDAAHLNMMSIQKHHPIHSASAQRTSSVDVPQPRRADGAETLMSTRDEHCVGSAVKARVAKGFFHLCVCSRWLFGLYDSLPCLDYPLPYAFRDLI